MFRVKGLSVLIQDSWNIPVPFTFSLRFLAGVHLTVALACTEDDGCPIYYNLSGGTLVILGTPAVLGRRRPDATGIS